MWGRIQTRETQPVAPIWPRARKVTSILVLQLPGYLVTWLPDTGYLVTQVSWHRYLGDPGPQKAPIWIPFWDFVAHGRAFRGACGAFWLVWRAQGSWKDVFTWLPGCLLRVAW